MSTCRIQKQFMYFTIILPSQLDLVQLIRFPQIDPTAETPGSTAELHSFQTSFHSFLVKRSHTTTNSDLTDNPISVKARHVTSLPEQCVLPKTHTQLVVAHCEVIDLFRWREIDPLLVEDRLFFLQPHVHESCRTRQERSTLKC